MAAKGRTGTSKTRRMFYPGLDTVGRHYLVQEQDADGYPTGNARQYTVATTMEPALYEAYTSALANPASGTDGLKKAIEASRDKSDEITLCIKNYDVGGLSNAIHSRHNLSIFNVSGPMGRPLAINLNGLNIAFVAGTGVLPLMDLVGFVTRSTLQLSDIDSSAAALGKGFKLAMCARFRDNEAIGDKLMSALTKANESQFMYQRGQWTASQIEEKIASISQKAGGAEVSNIYVCGPPKMNQEFEERLRDLQASGKISNVTQLHIL